MGATTSRTDFEWSYTDEPHATRRELILRKYPEIKKLMKVDGRFKYIVSALVFTQILSFFIVVKYISSFWALLVIAYLFGGVINHALTLAVHEISHNQAFGHTKPIANKLFGFFANLPLGFPMSITFKKYHLEHHRYQGDELQDTDIPCHWETVFFTNTLRKFFWVILQPVFYSVRPLFVYPKNPGPWEFANFIVQMSFNFFIGYTCGWHVVAYMMGGTFLAMGMHPVAGHFISEHYLMFEINKDKLINKAMELNQIKQLSEDDLSNCEFINGVYAHDGKFIVPETCSYYGPLNWLTFNVGYHVEHHDFPSIPGRYLPLVREIAPEFYNCLHSHSSWVKVIYRYITDPAVGPFSRVRRMHDRKNVKNID